MAISAVIHWEMSRAWNGRDFDRMRELMHPEFTYAGADGKEIAGPEAATAVAKTFTSAFPDAVVRIIRAFTDGETAIAEAVVTGTQRGNFMGIPATGERAELRVCNIVELRNGKIFRMREYYDMMTFTAQLGALKIPGAEAASA